jgi:hypothetical protein
MVALLSVVFSSAVAVTAATDPVVAPSASASVSVPTPIEMLLVAADRRVRAPDPKIKALLAEGLRRSPTFAALLVAINRSDVIVYIEHVMTLPKDTLGRLTMVPIAGVTRYLRIQIRPDLSRNEAIALIGHELQHALEVADNASVRDTNGMIALYERIGHSSGGEHVYDTTAAQDRGRQVRRELTMTVSLDGQGMALGVGSKDGATPAGAAFATK